MDETLLKILKKVYYKKTCKKDKNGNEIRIETGDVFDLKTLTRHYSTENLSSKELFYSRGQRAKQPRWRGYLATAARVEYPAALLRGI